VVFAEHYPLREKEQALFEKLQLNPAIVYSSLTEPLFKAFGGENIISLVQKLGIDENEAMEHKMISNYIIKAQEKLKKKVIIDNSAGSAEVTVSNI
jgi:hypothetical protein